MIDENRVFEDIVMHKYVASDNNKIGDKGIGDKGKDDKKIDDKGLGDEKHRTTLHILFPGGDPIASAIYDSLKELEGKGHKRFEATGIEDALITVSDWYKNEGGKTCVKEFELIAHGTSWKKDANGTPQIDPPSLLANDRKIDIDELKNIKISSRFQEPFNFVERFILTACNMGYYSNEYISYRELLAQKFFGFTLVPKMQPSVEFRSCNGYLNISRWPWPNSPSEDTVSPPHWLEEEKMHITVEAYYRNNGKLISKSYETGPLWIFVNQ